LPIPYIFTVLSIIIFDTFFCHIQGERKGQENLKTDLVRRIKMLEYALKQERAKYAKVGHLHVRTVVNQNLGKQKCPTKKWKNIMFEKLDILSRGLKIISNCFFLS
jgi:hypothetical protein